MAHRGSWGVFVDVPRARSLWTKKVLNTLGDPVKDGGAHALPHVYKPDEFMWAWVREPAAWLRSIMLYRLQRDWRPVGETISPWHMLMNATSLYATDNFEEFAIAISNERPGIVYWFYGLLIPEWVRWEHCERADYWLNQWFGVTEFPPPANQTPEEWIQPITPKAHAAIKRSEYETYWKYGYTL